MALRFVDNFANVTETYPANPNGSPNGITAVSNESGRVTIMMPHPERVFRTVSIPGTRRSGAKTARGCVFSATHVSNWVDYPHPDPLPKRERGKS
ncbi:phosphoribosylformylglycinamidine synthase subunit PurQ [Cedecea neteri]|uniref:phosphoribosylformylglycinamidine synthase subunit PurQ n=1 Tax=Cedecea neteri TaxID=158822 RepID=UPI000B12982C